MNYLNKLTPVNRFAHWNALGSFIIGTISLLSYFIFKGKDLIDIGFSYLSIAFIWNLLVLLLVIIVAIGKKTSRIETIKTIVIMLLNIPIAFCYFLIVIEFR